MTNAFHQDILKLIRQNSGKPIKDALNSYMGNDHFRYQITTPALRGIARDWMRHHKGLSPAEFSGILTSLIEGPSFTEKMMAGILMGYSAKAQRKFDPAVFDTWLDHLVGWAEIDAVCTGNLP